MQRFLIAFFSIIIPSIFFAQSADTCLIQGNIEIFPKDTTVCKNALVTVSVNAKSFDFSPTTVFEWYDLTQNIRIDTSQRNTVVVKTQITKTIRCIAIDGNCRDTVEAIITIKDTIELPIIADSSVCYGTVINVTTPQLGQKQINWSFTSPNNYECKNLPICNTIAITVTNTTTISYTDNATCYIGKPTTIKVVNLATTRSLYKLCLDDAKDSITLNNGTKLTAVKYEWIQLGNPSFKSALPSPKVYPSTSTTYFVKMSKDNCAKTDTIQLIVGNNYSLSVVKDTTICPNTPIKLSFKTDLLEKDYRSQWTPGGNVTSLTVSPTASQTYNLKFEYLPYRGSYLCTINRDVNITVLNPSVDVPKIITPAQSPRGFVIGTIVKVQIAKPTQNGSYTWTYNSEVLNTKDTIIEIRLTNASNTVSLSHQVGNCSKTVTIDIPALKPIFFPTIFLPEKDEVLKPIFLDPSLKMTLQSFSIFNRWGQRIYHTKTLADFQWKGDSFPSDVYLYEYHIDIEGTLYSEKGDVTLLR